MNRCCEGDTEASQEYEGFGLTRGPESRSQCRRWVVARRVLDLSAKTRRRAHRASLFLAHSYTSPTTACSTCLRLHQGRPCALEVIMSAAVALPQHRLLESPNSRTIEIGPWTITACTNPISNAGQSDALQAAIGGIPLPEMTFGNNSLELEHRESGWKYTFNTEEALKGVRNGELQEGDGGVKVGYADAWLRSRCDLHDVQSIAELTEKSELVQHLRSLCLRPSPRSYLTGRTRHYIPVMQSLRPPNQLPGSLPIATIPSILSPWQSSHVRIPSYSMPKFLCTKTSCMTMEHLIC